MIDNTNETIRPGDMGFQIGRRINASRPEDNYNQKQMNNKTKRDMSSGLVIAEDGRLRMIVIGGRERYLSNRYL